MHKTKLTSGKTIQICKKNNYYKYKQNRDYNEEINIICKEFVDDPRKWGVRENKFICTPIKKIHIYRNPISCKSIADILSFGQYENILKNANIDNLYHIFAIIETYEDIVIIEKNENIRISSNIPNMELLNTLENKTLYINNDNICILSLLCNCFINYNSPKEANTYDVISSNCQHFMYSFISLVCYDDEIIQFIWQNIDSLLKNFNPIIIDIFKVVIPSIITISKTIKKL